MGFLDKCLASVGIKSEHAINTMPILSQSQVAMPGSYASGVLPPPQGLYQAEAQEVYAVLPQPKICKKQRKQKVARMASAPSPDKNPPEKPLKSAKKSPKQVRFEAGTNAPTTERQPTFTEPTPLQAGIAPSADGLYLHTSANPTLSLNLTPHITALNSDFRGPGATVSTLANNTFGAPTFVHPGSHPVSPLVPGTTFIGACNPGVSAVPMQVATMSDNWPNSTPPAYGAVNFQPPVPDSTHGPIQHIYTPRHDTNVYVAHPGQGSVPHGVVVAPPATVVHGGPAYIHHPPAHGGIGVIALQPPIVMQAGPHPPPTPPPVLINGQFTTPGVAGLPIGVQGTPTYLVGQPGGPQVGFGGLGGYTMHSPGTVGLPPDVTGVGRTILETQALGAQYVAENRHKDVPDMQPRDSSPSRMYWCRELDGNWTHRTRFSIDQMGKEEWTWFWNDRDKDFYAVRQSSG